MVWIQNVGDIDFKVISAACKHTIADRHHLSATTATAPILSHTHNSAATKSREDPCGKWRTLVLLTAAP
jgi:hypothetical protein